jgi:starch synthase
MSGTLKICFAASEVAPFAKTGGLADVASALPARLNALGHDVRVFVPLHAQMETHGQTLTDLEEARNVEIDLGGRRMRFGVRVTTLPDTEVPVYLVDCPEMFDRSSVYTGGTDEPFRFTLFSRAIVEACQRLGWAPDVFHCNDWHTALVPLLLRSMYEWDSLFKDSRTLVTIHNIGYQGTFPREVLDELGLDNWSHLFDQDDLGKGVVNFLRTGLIYADVISTVSPTYAREIQTEEYGMGLEALLTARSSTLVGILNGVDYHEWSPEKDRFIPHAFSIDDMDGKAANKRDLLEKLGLEPTDSAPLLGIISRLAYQKGFELCFDVLPELLGRYDARLIVLGSGEAKYESFFEGLQQRFPGRVCYHRGYHNELAHVIEAAADLFLMPSRYEPCGLNQMFGMKYGTLPVVRQTGGLADSVEPIDPSSGTGTGFVFEHFSADGLRWALGQAMELWKDRDLWARLVRNAMEKNFSWDAQVEPYVELYRAMLRR